MTAKPTPMANAIERRLEHVRAIWNGFATDPKARLLIWRCDVDERRMIDMLVELETEPAGAATPDVFLTLRSAFLKPEEHAKTLLQELTDQFDHSRQDLVAANLNADWQPPDPGQPNGVRLLKALDSFHHFYADRMELLAIFLSPERIADPAGWRQWLERLARVDLNASIRFMVTDSLATPLLDGLEASAPDRIRSVEPALDMSAAVEELARSEGADGPAKTFRCSLAAVASAATKKNPQAAEKAAGQALAVAKEQNWVDQEVVIHMALGAARIGAGQADKAADSYRDAIVAAREATKADHPAGPKLEVVAGMALGSALVAGERWTQAARVYEAVAPLAGKADDVTMKLESLRMAAWCHEQAAADTDAWRCGLQALEAGEAMPPEQRASSTLPWVGQTLLRLIGQPGQTGEDAAQLRARLDAAMGAGWEGRLDPGATIS